MVGKDPVGSPCYDAWFKSNYMFGIAMLVIAALVGTNGLEQIVYIGLSDGNFGVGLIAGMGLAIIAMIADRMTQSWSRRRQEKYGILV